MQSFQTSPNALENYYKALGEPLQKTCNLLEYLSNVLKIPLKSHIKQSFNDCLIWLSTIINLSTDCLEQCFELLIKHCF